MVSFGSYFGLHTSYFKYMKKLLYIFIAITVLSIIGLAVGFWYVKNYPAKAYSKNIEKMPYDVIIVPGFPYTGSPWHDVVMIRMYWSKYLYENGATRNVIYSGAAVSSPYIESKIMAEYGKALGIPAENIFMDTLAEHSTENVYYSYKLAKSLGFKKIAVATDPFQSMAVSRFVKKQNLDVDFLPIVFDTLKVMTKTEPDIDPSVAYVEEFESLKEREGFFKRFRGTLGKNMNDSYYEGTE